MRHLPKTANQDFPLWLAYASVATNLAAGVLWLTSRRHRFVGVFWLASAAGWLWVSEAVRRGRATEGRGPEQVRQV